METESNLSDEDFEKLVLDESIDGDDGLPQTSPRLRLVKAQILDGELELAETNENDDELQSQNLDILSEMVEPLDETALSNSAVLKQMDDALLRLRQWQAEKDSKLAQQEKDFEAMTKLIESKEEDGKLNCESLRLLASDPSNFSSSSLFNTVKSLRNGSSATCPESDEGQDEENELNHIFIDKLLMEREKRLNSSSSASAAAAAVSRVLSKAESLQSLITAPCHTPRDTLDINALLSKNPLPPDAISSHSSFLSNSDQFLPLDGPRTDRQSNFPTLEELQRELEASMFACRDTDMAREQCHAITEEDMDLQFDLGSLEAQLRDYSHDIDLLLKPPEHK